MHTFTKLLYLLVCLPPPWHLVHVVPAQLHRIDNPRLHLKSRTSGENLLHPPTLPPLPPPLHSSTAGSLKQHLATHISYDFSIRRAIHHPQSSLKYMVWCGVWWFYHFCFSAFLLFIFYFFVHTVLSQSLL